MIDFYDVVEEDVNEVGYTYNPYAGKLNGEWIEGYTSIDLLNKNFGDCQTAQEMKEATSSEGLQLFFDWLVEQGKLPA